MSLTIEELKDWKEKVNPRHVIEHEAYDLAIKYKQIPENLEFMKKLKLKVLENTKFRKRTARKKINIEVALLNQLIRHLTD
jgi:hypothetical protein